MWRYIQPEIKQIENLRLNDLRSLYAANISALDAYIASPELRWQLVDSLVNNVVKNYSIPNVIIEIGEGTFFALPKYNGTIFDPNVVGKDLYLAYQYRISRAIVRRYKSLGIKLYQIENELNEAWLAGLYTQRRFELFGAWRSWDFLTTLLTTLNQAVKDEDSQAKTTMNFHTDVAKAFHQDLFLKGYYLDAVGEWHHLMDVVSLDAYPNMYVSEPVLASLVGERVASIRQLIGPHKPILVMETGYPITNSSQPIPSPVFNFTETRAAQYIEQVVQSVIQAGGNGVLYFKIDRSAGIQSPPGGYTQKDIEAMRMFSKLYQESSAWEFIKWVFQQGNLEYLLNRMSILLSGQEAGWALLHLDGSPRPIAVQALQKAFQDV